MMYNGVLYLNDNDSFNYNGCISLGDEDRLLHIARMNNLFTFDRNAIIKHIIREYYKEHRVADFIKETTGTEYKEYEEFLKIMREPLV